VEIAQIRKKILHVSTNNKENLTRRRNIASLLIKKDRQLKRRYNFNTPASQDATGAENESGCSAKNSL